MEKILIIDDNNLHAVRLRDILQDEYEITIAKTAEEGFDQVKMNCFSLILLDVVMPGMDGFTLLKKLQEELVTRNIPVIMITGLNNVEDEERGLTLGAVDYIRKPFHPVIVKARVNTHVKLYSYRKQIEYQSKIDQLTGIANRRQHDQYSVMKWNEAVRLQTPVSVCMFDIDRFKAYNDAFGHPAGDKVIATVAKTASGHLQRSTDFLARYGGEEFAVFILGNDAETAFQHMIKVRQSIEDLHIEHPDSVTPWVTISIGGVTVIPKYGNTYDSYLKIADSMLYDAKKFGRNRVIWADEEMKQMLEK